MLINKRTSRQVTPFVSLKDGDPLPVVSEMRLLGLVIDSDLSWWPLVRDIVSRSKAKVWSLVKLREAGASIDQLVTLYIARVRSTVEYGCQVYGTILNGAQDKMVEDIQKKCCQIILGS